MKSKNYKSSKQKAVGQWSSVHAYNTFYFYRRDQTKYTTYWKQLNWHLLYRQLHTKSNKINFVCKIMGHVPTLAAMLFLYLPDRVMLSAVFLEPKFAYTQWISICVHVFVRVCEERQLPASRHEQGEWTSFQLEVPTVTMRWEKQEIEANEMWRCPTSYS